MTFVPLMRWVGVHRVDAAAASPERFRKRCGAAFVSGNIVWNQRRQRN
jgi:hypothetical protein